LVLAVIVGIGSTLFSQFTAGFGGNQPTIDNAMALVLGALSLLGLGIFGPGIANGIVSGGPQLGAGAAVGTGLAAGGAIVAGAGIAERLQNSCRSSRNKIDGPKSRSLTSGWVEAVLFSS
jgi:type IV secretion system protein TrbL